MKHQKIAPGLLLAMQAFEAPGSIEEKQASLRVRARMMALPRVVPMPPVVARPTEPTLPVPALAHAPKAVVFIHFKSAKSKLAATTNKLLEVNQKSGAIRTAYVSLDVLGKLSDDPTVEFIRPARYLRPKLDAALPRVKVPAFRASSHLSGKRIAIGIVDSGIDPQHPAFAGRIERIWDQTLPTANNGVPEGAYGVELSGGMLGTSRDRDGHGTHVAGIAAGKDPAFGGVAPEARLIIVKTDFNDAHISDAIRYIFRVATDLGLDAAVVNLSLGGHSDAHDGSDSLSQVIDTECGPGHIVCCAAGNEGSDNIHGQVSVSGAGITTARFLVPTNAVGLAELNGWYSGAQKLEVSVESPGGFVTPFQKVFSTGNPVRSYSLPNADIIIATPGPDPTNGDHHFLAQVQGKSGGAVAGGTWKLRLRGVGLTVPVTVDVWSLDDQKSPQVVFTGTSINRTMKIGSPGVAAAAVTVAAFTTKKAWVDETGTNREVGLTLDTIADFSSPGPTRNGRQKPDVTAPGAMIVSARSADSSPESAFCVDADHLVEAGTSMATPLITGVVALLLQRDPTLDPAGVKALLAANSSIPGQPAGTVNAEWGAGLIDAVNL